jgi:hypothetical protein
MDMRFGTWKIISLYRTGLLKTVTSELAKYKLHLVAVQKVKWDKGGGQPAVDYTFFYSNGNADHHLGTDFFIQQSIRSAVKMSYMILRSHWCDIIVLNIHVPSEDKSDDTKIASVRN